MNKINFVLQGLHCESCVKIATMEFEEIPEVKNVSINLATGETVITADREIDLKEFESALKNTDYKIIKN